MRFRRWLCRLMRFVRALAEIRERGVVVLWRVSRTLDGQEIVYSFTEPAPGTFHAVMTRGGIPETRRVVHGLDAFMRQAEEAKTALEVEGWYEIDGPRQRGGTPMHRRHTPTHAATDAWCPDSMPPPDGREQ